MVDCCDPEDKRKEDIQGCHQADLTAEGFQLTGLQKTDYLFPQQLSMAYTEVGVPGVSGGLEVVGVGF